MLWLGAISTIDNCWSTKASKPTYEAPQLSEVPQLQLLFTDSKKKWTGST